MENIRKYKIFIHIFDYNMNMLISLAVFLLKWICCCDVTAVMSHTHMWLSMCFIVGLSVFRRQSNFFRISWWWIRSHFRDKQSHNQQRLKTMMNCDLWLCNQIIFLCSDLFNLLMSWCHFIILVYTFRNRWIWLAWLPNERKVAFLKLK